jgi:hypothetical protein
MIEAGHFVGSFHSFALTPWTGEFAVQLLYYLSRRLLEGVGAGSPVGEEQAEADSLEDTSNSTDGDGVKRTLLGQDLGDDLVIVSTWSIQNIEAEWWRTEGAAEAKKIKEPR